MNDKSEFSGAMNGMACAFALLIDVLEANGALKPKQFEAELGSVLRHTAGDIGSEIALLNHIMSVLQVPENGTGSV